MDMSDQGTSIKLLDWQRLVERLVEKETPPITGNLNPDLRYSRRDEPASEICSQRFPQTQQGWMLPLAVTRLNGSL